MKILDSPLLAVSRVWIIIPLALLILIAEAATKTYWLRHADDKAYLFDPPTKQKDRHSSPPGNTRNSDLTTLEIQVTDGASQGDIPCRITIVDEQGTLAPLSPMPDQQLAVRPGVIYTLDGQAKVKVVPGKYKIFATRGFEYSLAKQEVFVSPGSLRKIQLDLRREVPTPRLVSCDTHVHTLTYSGHGDATIDERMITLAGEGIELPVATDHNYLTDYAVSAQRTGVQRYFTPVIGAEVTTKKGHFNVFPIKPGSTVPDFRIEDWAQLMRSIRSTPGVQAVVLNHPRDLHSNFRPFDQTNFNPVTGESRRGSEFSFNALEVINSGALQSDFMRLFNDWFALLNYGYRVTAVGSSDSHDVGEYIVGQGRTYLACNDNDPARINIGEACRSMLEGRALVSMGLLTEMRVNDKYGVGDLATGLGKEIRVEVAVYGPSWIGADRVELFANGIKIYEKPIAPSTMAVEKIRVRWTLRKPGHDVHLVAIASGPGATAPHWPIHPPYQPTSPVWHPRVIGATNPIWIDADGNSSYTPPRHYAAALLQRFGPDPQKLLPALARYDQTIAAQAASLYRAAGRDVRDAEFARLLKTASTSVRLGFSAFTTTLPPK